MAFDVKNGQCVNGITSRIKNLFSICEIRNGDNHSINLTKNRKHQCDAKHTVLTNLETRTNHEIVTDRDDN